MLWEVVILSLPPPSRAVAQFGHILQPVENPQKIVQAILIAQTRGMLPLRRRAVKDMAKYDHRAAVPDYKNLGINGAHLSDELFYDCLACDPAAIFRQSGLPSHHQQVGVIELLVKLDNGN